MRYLRWILRILLFVLLLGFAIKNTDPVVVHYFLGWEWHASLSLVLLAFFASGAGLGVLAGGAWAYHQRREVLRLQRELRAGQPSGEPADRAPTRRLP